MHRNGIQLSGTTAKVMDRDPRPVVSSLGIQVIEIASLHDRPALFAAYAEALALARHGQPSLIYPTGYRTVRRIRGSPWRQLRRDVRHRRRGGALRRRRTRWPSTPRSGFPAR